MYNPLHRSALEILAKNRPNFWWNEHFSFRFIPFFRMNLAIFLKNVHQIWPEFNGNAQKMADIPKCWQKVHGEIGKRQQNPEFVKIFIGAWGLS